MRACMHVSNLSEKRLPDYSTGYFYSQSNAVCISHLSQFVSPCEVNEQHGKMMNNVMNAVK